MSNICILATGGTIDKEHDVIVEGLVFSEHSYVPEMLKQCRVPDIPHEILMLKDSEEFTDEDRQVIQKAILKRPEPSIVVTHGTGTMEVTAEYLDGQVDDKTVVLTGALRPFSLFESDAGFNLGSAIVAARLAEPGVYIAMNGQVFKAGAVTKNREKGHFERK